jgi:hypothetical protein
MKPIEVFRNGRERAEYLLRLHELLCNTRRRGTREDWARNFKRMMHWRQREQIHRVDGRQSVVVLREGAAITPEQFQEGALNELVRAALVGVVSALDRYCHDLVVSRIVRTLGRSEKRINKELRQLQIPIMAARMAVWHARIRRGKGGRIRTRPMTIIRHAIQDMLYRESYQGPEEINRALRMVEIEDLWRGCATAMDCTAKDVVERLKQVVDRRNKIVHEGDVLRRRRGGKLALHPVSRRQVLQDVQWVGSLVDAIETIANQ